MTGNAAHWFVDRHIAEGRGAKTAFEEAWEGGRQLTYGALAVGAGQVADALTRSGISREARAAANAGWYRYPGGGGKVEDPIWRIWP